METQSTRLLRERQKEVRANLDRLRPKVAVLEAEDQQIEDMLRIAEGPIPIKGTEATANALRIHAQNRHPEVKNLTIKQMVVKALGEHLVSGATSVQLLEFFAKQWGRTEIMRTSLSPQLSRLKESGIIELQGKVWHLARDEVPISEVLGEMYESDTAE
jgi:hypothetical protein